MQKVVGSSPIIRSTKSPGNGAFPSVATAGPPGRERMRGASEGERDRPVSLIVNADDFGASRSINRGVARAHDDGIVTSASAIVHGQAVGEAVEVAGSRPELSVGLHFVYESMAADAGDVAEALEAQLDRFRSLFGRDPTHIDSHHHVHRREPVRTLVLAAGRRLGVPVRHDTPGIVHRGDFYGQTPDGRPLPHAITVEALLGLIGTLPAGITELGCHPGVDPEAGSSYARERPLELAALCDPRVRAALDARAVVLRSFAGLPGPR